MVAQYLKSAIIDFSRIDLAFRYYTAHKYFREFFQLLQNYKQYF